MVSIGVLRFFYIGFNSILQPELLDDRSNL